MRRRSTICCGLVLCVLASSSVVLAQGRGYFNVESPQVDPITVARIAGHDYVLACNTPDNRLEIWDTDESVPVSSRMLARARTGLEPVSVLWVPELSRAYVANFLGDSITSIALAAPDGPSSLTATVLSTTSVTDEPLDMAFAFVDVAGSNTPVLFVTHMTLDAVGKYNAKTLLPIQPGSERLDVVVSSGQDLDFDLMLDDVAIKEPRTPLVGCDKLLVLGHKGGNTIRYDFDLYAENLTTGIPDPPLGGLGSTNAHMAFASNGDLFVVGGMARNKLRNESAVAAASTGFVKAMFYLVEGVCSGSPVIHKRDVNLRKLLQQQPQQHMQMQPPGASAQPVPTTGPVGRAKSLAQLTSVAPFEENGSVSKVFFTAFGTDRIGIIEPDAASDPLDWPIRRRNVSPLVAPIAGPRGLALKDGTGGDDDPGPRLYVLNRFDNSITIFDPVAESFVESFRLSSDPTPVHITAGRKFLYDAKLSASAKNSCASCHIDGRTDGLPWDLGDDMPQPIPRELMPTNNFAGGIFPGDKEFMITQSLQGLLNWEVEPESQKLFTNAPYHWRADREDFLAFEPAFESLLLGDELQPGEMEMFEEFVNSIHYPPNPKLARSRILSGELGDPDDDDANNDIDGEGALLGLKIFHIVQTDFNGACVQCHHMPEGSDNVLTENIGGVNPHPLQDPPLAFAPAQPMETAALRFLFQKEARLDRDGSSAHEDSPITGYEGLFHTGLVDTNTSPDFNGTATINGFNSRFFGVPRLCNAGDPLCKNLRALNQFVHEFDTGSSPMIGNSLTVTIQNKNAQTTIDTFKETERQAEAANAGVVVQAWVGGQRRGFWYDLTVDPQGFREEPTDVIFKRTQLLDLIRGNRDRLVLMAVPLGSERRLAHPDGQPSLQQGDSPSAVALLPMVTNSAYRAIPQLTKLWDDGTAQLGSTHSHTVRLYQHGLRNNPTGGYGLCELRHEAPRRFRISGKNVRHGAELHLFIQDDPDNGPPDTDLGPKEAGQVQTLRIALPLHPTGLVDDSDQRIWETAVELEPMLFYRLMAGRPDQSGQFAGVMVNVTDRDHLILIDPENQPGLFTPDDWNKHYVRVVNPDTTEFDAGWLPLEIEPGPDCQPGGGI